MNEDDKQLNLLTIFHYIVGGLMAFFSCIPFIHLFLGLAMIFSPQSFSNGQQPPPEFMGYLFAIIGGAFIIIGFTTAMGVIISGRFISKRKKHFYSFFMACLMCLFVPLGTILGVFTIIILSRDSVKNLYKIEGD